MHVADLPSCRPHEHTALFSAGIYACREQLGGEFAAVVDGLLMDTGRMRAEDLAAKHLDADLTDEQFWSEAVEYVLRDVDDFAALADELAAGGPVPGGRVP